jgi:hypothetical protein
VLSIDKTSITALDRMRLRPFSSMGRAIFSLLGVKPEGKKQEMAEEEKKEEEDEEAEHDMVSTISFIQANLQQSIAPSTIFTRTVSAKGIDMALIQEPWYREDCTRGLNIPGYTVLRRRNR